MSIDTGIPDLENVAKESDELAEDEIEIEDSSDQILKKKDKLKFW